MTEIVTESTSRSTAQASDLVLRLGQNTRLIFRPSLVDNARDKEASVRGIFLYQRKKKNDEWVDFETIPLSSVKSGEGFKLELKSAELLSVYEHISVLYDLYASAGVPKGKRKYVQVTPQLEALSSLPSLDLANLLSSKPKLGDALFSKMLEWACTAKHPNEIITRLAEISADSLETLNAAVGLNRLKSALRTWEQNIDNPDEEFWQQSLTENSFVLEHLYTWPTTIVKGKAYVGGKSVFNSGGNIVDFLVKNQLTQNAALIEIKTPTTELVGPPYRQTYNTSSELSGSIMQVLNYKHSLQENYLELTRGMGDLFDSFNPQCAVIIGNASIDLSEKAKVKAFELYRAQLQGVNVFTFDELFGKTRALIDVLERSYEGAEGTDVENPGIPI